MKLRTVDGYFSKNKSEDGSTEKTRGESVCNRFAPRRTLNEQNGSSADQFNNILGGRLSDSLGINSAAVNFPITDG